MIEIQFYTTLVINSICMGRILSSGRLGQLFNILLFYFVLFYEFSDGNHNCEFIGSQWTPLHLAYLHGVIYFSCK